MSKTKAKIVLTPQARAIVKQAITNIKAKPDQFDMDHWVGKNKTPKALRTCGTSACLAGHIVLAAGLRVQGDGDHVPTTVCKRKLGFVPENSYTDFNGSQYSYVSNIATQLLGVDHDTANRLYITNEWPKKFRDEYQALTYKPRVDGEDEEYITPTATTLKRRANLAVRRLRYFLKEGK